MNTIDSILIELRRTALRAETATLSDGQLLDRYLAKGDASAFEALVVRHGPMVLGVCRRILGNAEDAEDAFQAAFLVLVRKARSVLPRELVGNWLYGVACHTAQQARAAAARRQARERDAAARPRPQMLDGLGQLREALDAELRSLPEKYRAAVVLCDLEGKTRKEVAGQLGWAEGTVASRLSRGRDLLGQRLRRAGVGVSASALAGVLAEGAALARVSGTLLTSTTHAAALFAAGSVTAAGAISAGAVALTEGVLRAMWITKLKIGAAVVLATAVAGAGLLGHLSMATGQVGQNPYGNTNAGNYAQRSPTPMGVPPKQEETAAVKALIKALNDPSPEVRGKAAEILGGLGQEARPAIPALIRALKDSNADVRAKAVEVLQHFADTSKAAEDKDADRRQKDTVAGLGLSRLGGEGATMAGVRLGGPPGGFPGPVPGTLQPAVGPDDQFFFAPDGKRLAVVRGGHEIDIIDAQTGKTERTLSSVDRIASLTFSPNGSMLVLAGRKRGVDAFDLNTGKLIWNRGGGVLGGQKNTKPSMAR